MLSSKQKHETYWSKRFLDWWTEAWSLGHWCDPFILISALLPTHSDVLACSRSLPSPLLTNLHPSLQNSPKQHLPHLTSKEFGILGSGIPRYSNQFCALRHGCRDLLLSNSSARSKTIHSLRKFCSFHYLLHFLQDATKEIRCKWPPGFLVI